AAAAGGWRAGRARRRRRRGGEKEEEDDDDEEGGPGTEAVLRRLREARGHSDPRTAALTPPPAGAVRAPLSGPAEPPARCVCYGLGRFGRCPAARYQLAFLLLLLDELRVPPGRCALFDPAFSAREAAALRALGLCLLTENEVSRAPGSAGHRGRGSAVTGSALPGQEGKRGVQGAATLFYMVHCGKALYNNLLWSNWSPAALSKLVIIGNSFRGIEERLLSRILERDYSYIAKVLKGVEEVALPSHPRYLDTFNDTSVHWFPLDKLQELSPEVWDFVEEPMYQDCEDLEIIRKGEE
ncbi:SRR1L protein, partial [Erithacus rubecula]|nr:SRR1L protein [Erithacus rubecula]